MSRPSSFTRFPSASTMYLPVEPVPRPTIMPSLIHSTAFVPTNCFNSSWLINYTPFKHRIPKLYNNEYSSGTMNSKYFQNYSNYLLNNINSMHLNSSYDNCHDE